MADIFALCILRQIIQEKNADKDVLQEIEAPVVQVYWKWTIGNLRMTILSGYRLFEKYFVPVIIGV